MTRVVLVEDHAVLRQGLAELLDRQQGLRVIGHAGEIAEGVELIVRSRPDVVLSDVMFGDAPQGLELPGALRALGLDAAVIFLSSFDTLWFHRSAVAAGARGYLLKSVPLAELMAAINTVTAGGTVFAAHAVGPTSARDRAPSPREREVLSLVASGAGNGEVATTLGISDRTVESHLARLFQRYDVASRTELSMLAIDRGWVRAPRGRGPGLRNAGHVSGEQTSDGVNPRIDPAP